MCGIIGYSSKNQVSKSKLKMLYIMAMSRGLDGAGIATKKSLVKSKETGYNFILNTEFREITEFIGHTRGRSSGAGKASDRNSHPFAINGLRGVHNGYINNHTQVGRRYDLDYEVDSEVVYHLIAKHGLKKALSEVTGTMTLVWYDNEKKIHFYRSNNPLFIGYIDDDMYWGSQEDYLEVVGCDNIKAIDENTHYIISNGEIISQTKLAKSEQPSRYYNNYYRGTQNRRRVSSTNNKNKKEREKKKDPSWKDEKVNTNSIIQPLEAPEYADYACINGKVVYFWHESEERAVYVESINGYGDSVTHKYNIGKTKENAKSLKRDYKYVYDEMRIDELINNYHV